MSERATKFLASYYHDGSWWGIEFYAAAFEDAEVICKAHSLRLDGEHVMTLPAVAGSWLPNVVVRARNLLRRVRRIRYHL